MKPAMFYVKDQSTIDSKNIVGRHSATMGITRALIQYTQSDENDCMYGNKQDYDYFAQLVNSYRPGGKHNGFHYKNIEALKKCGGFYFPGPDIAQFASHREHFGVGQWSIIGVNHTICTHTIMDGLLDFALNPLMPWDAVICTAQCGKRVLEDVLSANEQHLARTLRAKNFPRPTMPVIPLGIFTDDFSGFASHRDEARASLDIPEDAIVALYLGRFDLKTKSSPIPTYIAAEAAAKKRPVVVIDCGQSTRAYDHEGYVDAAQKLAPSVRHIMLDGGNPDDRARSWAAADIFCSFPDNIQESFGLTPIEAMAAGLPVLASDWNGYRESVRHGVDGLLVPTMMPEPGNGMNAIINYHYNGRSGYNSYASSIAWSCAIDLEAAITAFETLASQPDLRKRMGEAGQKRAREVYDWKTVIAQYENLWNQLEQKRLKAIRENPSLLRGNVVPGRQDPFSLFNHFASRTIKPATRLFPSVMWNEAKIVSQLAMNDPSQSPWIGEATMDAMMIQVNAEKGTQIRDITLPGKSTTDIIHICAQLMKFGVVKQAG